MWPAQVRAATAVPRTLEDLRPAKGTVALRCSMPGCRKCLAFKSQQPVYERALRAKGVIEVIPWNCKHKTRRDIALNAGVDDLPAYVLLSARGKPCVVTPGQGNSQ